MPARRITPNGGAGAAGLSLLAAMAVFTQGMAPQLLAHAAFGPICSAHRSALHCPSCYVAATLLLGALAVLLAPGFTAAPPRAAARAR